jgi:hypothetical protein
MPRSVHVFFAHAGAPHWLGTPPPPHVCPSGHVAPHWITLPQPSPIGPQLAFASAHV